MNNPTPEGANWVYACPECDRAGSTLYERANGTVVCYNCDTEVEHKGQLRMRSDRRGTATNPAYNRRGGRAYSPSSEEARRAGKQGGHPPKYAGTDD